MRRAHYAPDSRLRRLSLKRRYRAIRSRRDINAKSQNVVICIIHAQYSGNNHGSCGYHK
jgi:hypothetical protein